MDQMDDTQWAQIENLVDKNHDGKITLQEYIDFNKEQQVAQGDPSKQMEQGLKALDLNHDGNLDKVDNNKILYILTSIRLTSVILRGEYGNLYFIRSRKSAWINFLMTSGPGL